MTWFLFKDRIKPWQQGGAHRTWSWLPPTHLGWVSDLLSLNSLSMIILTTNSLSMIMITIILVFLRNQFPLQSSLGIYLCRCHQHHPWWYHHLLHHHQHPTILTEQLLFSDKKCNSLFKWSHFLVKVMVRLCWTLTLIFLRVIFVGSPFLSFTAARLGTELALLVLLLGSSHSMPFTKSRFLNWCISINIWEANSVKIV